MPKPDVEIEDVPELMTEEEEEEDYEVERILAMTMDLDGEEGNVGEEFEEGDQIFYMALHPEEQEHVWTYATISTQLAEAWHKQNNVPKMIPKLIPQYLHDFEDVFAKSSFDSLPECKHWDHGIKLVPGAQPSFCKIYPLSPNKQEELDKFLEEHLASGWIRPSKSPMASPFFFIKKKDGKLHPVQDYRKLNLITIKNTYPLPLISELINQL